MAIKQEIIDELLKDYKNPEDLLDDDGLFKALKKALVERALNAELTDHLSKQSVELRRLKAELVRVTEERDILKKPPQIHWARTSQGMSSEVRLH